MPSMQEITWKAPEFVQYRKGPGWMVAFLAVGAILIGYFLFQRDFLAALMFALLLILGFYFSKARPKVMDVKIDARGIKLNDTRLLYQHLKSFWIVYDPPEVKTLNFETTAYFNRFLTLELMDQDPVKIREFLLKYLPEDLDRQESLSDQISRKLKF